MSLPNIFFAIFVICCKFIIASEEVTKMSPQEQQEVPETARAAEVDAEMDSEVFIEKIRKSLLGHELFEPEDDQEGHVEEVVEEEDTATSITPDDQPTPLPVSNGTSKAPTFLDIISSLGGRSPLPPHLQLTLVGAHSNISAVNLTSNVTAAPEMKKITCRVRDVSSANQTHEYSYPSVRMVSSRELLQRLSITNDTQTNCIVVLFYAPWCPFCARVAPHFNALPRVFPQLDFMAIDAIHFNNLNARFGTTAVPNLLFFHKSKIVRFNSTVRTVDAMASFIHNITSLEYNHTTVRLRDMDYLGPVATIPSRDRDHVLWLSWICILFFTSYMFSRTHTAVRLWNYVNSFGAAHEHHHID